MPESTFNVDDHENLHRAFLVGIQTATSADGEPEEMLEELGELVKTLELEIVGSCVAKMRVPNPAYGIGSGKVMEIIAMAQEAGADVIILDDPMSPAQQRNWENLSGEIVVIDRQEVILDIFAARAHTSEAVLQVNLAKANYALPRLKRRFENLSRQRGAAGGLGGRAGGEQQLELDSRLIRKAIAKYNEQLAEVRKQRDVQRQKRLRRPVPVAAIVGYTNAGKSTLLNTLTQAGVLAENKLFATLDPTVRRFKLPGGQDVLLADTVGFIRKLPHQLVEAFKATLEETKLADYIIEVLDASAPSVLEHHETTLNVLEELGCNAANSIVVLNKIDLIESPMDRAVIQMKFPGAIPVSAKTGLGLEELCHALEDKTTQSLACVKVLVPHDRYDVVSKIRAVCSIYAEEYRDEGVYLEFKMTEKVKSLAEPFMIEE